MTVMRVVAAPADSAEGESMQPSDKAALAHMRFHKMGLAGYSNRPKLSEESFREHGDSGYRPDSCSFAR